ncbi:hypothetical protein GCM10007874_31840 [Labrys miyagiensis]|uniref:Uncharacterized protein n=1 Tax=Labrys miyagiensis TaxID=346912 RepID=A0ABQ6CKK9_9HYPH|nr:hypothetical protein [Labrys miyagiensis]GLS20167.1 hypothetical protein GCM10007874_31840 [Labrys miyagiensis]
MKEVTALADQCNDMLRNGMDFPEIWNSHLRGRWLVIGPPLQAYRREEPVLEIPLGSLRALVFHSDEGLSEARWR